MVRGRALEKHRRSETETHGIKGSHSMGENQEGGGLENSKGSFFIRERLSTPPVTFAE